MVETRQDDREDVDARLTRQVLNAISISIIATALALGLGIGAYFAFVLLGLRA